MIQDYSYEIRIEDRDLDGNVLGSVCEFITRDKNQAIKKAKEIRSRYPMTVIEIYDGDDFIDTYCESEY